jgi:hypothetical protein
MRLHEQISIFEQVMWCTLSLKQLSNMTYACYIQKIFAGTPVFRDDHMRKRTFTKLLLNIHTSNFKVTRRWTTNSFLVLPKMLSAYDKCVLFGTLLRLKRKYMFIISCSWRCSCHSGISKNRVHMKFVEHYEIIQKHIIKISWK